MSKGILKTVSTKSVLGSGGTKDLLPDLIKLKDEKNNVLPLMRIYGIAQRVRPGTKDDREFIQFIGEFEAVNLINGNTYTSGRAYVQDYIADQIYSKMRDPDTGELKEAQFALEVGAHYDPSSITSYVYDVKTMVEPQPTDKMKMLKHLAAQPFQLEAAKDDVGQMTDGQLKELQEASDEQPQLQETDFLHGDIDHIVPPSPDSYDNPLDIEHNLPKAKTHNEAAQVHADAQLTDDLLKQHEKRTISGTGQHHKGKHDKQKHDTK